MSLVANFRLVSTSASGVAGNGDSSGGVFSPDGTLVLFNSASTNLVSGDTNGVQDIFLKNIVSGAISRVSIDAGGAQANGASTELGFSPDGHTVYFTSAGSNLVGSDPDGAGLDVFSKNLTTGVVTLVSDGGGTHFANASGIKLSADATKIIFSSTDGVLHGAPADTSIQVYVQDLSSGVITDVSRPASAITEGNAWGGIFSTDGTKAAFRSSGQLDAGDTNGQYDVFVVDLGSGAVTRLTNIQDQGLLTPYVGPQAFSPDGSKLYYDSVVTYHVGGTFYTGDDLHSVVLGSGVDQITPGSQSALFSPDGALLATSGWAELPGGLTQVSFGEIIRLSDGQSASRKSVV